MSCHAGEVVILFFRNFNEPARTPHERPEERAAAIGIRKWLAKRGARY
jgi:hypothetical protein